ncbi:XTP/dITP diphosphatase [Paenibacillus tarimensis]
MKLEGELIVVATKNKGKVREFTHAFAEMGCSVKSMHDYDGLPDIIEDGETFTDNALLKARAVAEALGVPVLADDSGLCVDALGGAPGVFSARYAGEGAADRDNNAKLLQELSGALREQEDIPEDLALPEGARALSRARFVCALALYDPSSGETAHSKGEAEGWIIDRPLGEGGFGYDPLFWVPSFGCTMAQLTTGQKQRISHRGQALAKLIKQVSVGNK